MRRRIRGARGNEVHGAAEADEAREEEGRRGFHDEAAARKHEADFCVFGREPYRHGERQGDADADGGAVHCGDGGLAAGVDCEGDAAASGESVLAEGSSWLEYRHVLFPIAEGA